MSPPSHGITGCSFCFRLCSLPPFGQFDAQEVADQLDMMRAQSKGQEFNEAVAKDKIEATLEKNLVSPVDLGWSVGGRMSSPSCLVSLDAARAPVPPPPPHQNRLLLSSGQGGSSERGVRGCHPRFMFDGV